MRKQVLHPRTAAINQKQKNLSKIARLEALNWLVQKFPKAFDNSECIQPLHLGIMEDILKYADDAAIAGVSKSKLREAVVLFTRRLDYLACLKVRGMRIDLNGNPTEMVTEEDAERAAIKIKKRIDKGIRNAKRVITPTESRVAKPYASSSSVSSSNISSYERPPAYSVQHAVAVPARTSSVTVKHKQTRQYDPEAVARLKEKLGLSRKQEEMSESEND